MRLYSVAITSLAIDAPVKWTDNLLSQHPVPDVRNRSRGVARGVSWSALLRIGLIRELHIRVGCGVREAVALSGELLAAPSSAIRLGDRLTMSFDRAEFERTLHQRLAEALETAPRPRRGRPPGRATSVPTD